MATLLRAAPLRRLIRCLLVAVAFVPFVPALVLHVPAFAWLGRALDAWFAFQCERDPARMLRLGAVCARCLGLYVGFGLGALVGRPRLAPPRLELLLAAAALAMGADVASEALGWRPPSAPLRFATGFTLAYTAGVIVVAWLEGPSPRREAAQNP
ncbi:MAG TPA: DUF2085 domain-containing protein [Polyangiaceae bacterium]|nr:DUF2085 domain-containing protein [Polyangiaceae bacterium]